MKKLNIKQQIPIINPKESDCVKPSIIKRNPKKQSPTKFKATRDFLTILNNLFIIFIYFVLL